MPPPAILDVSTLDLTRILASHEEILRYNPQRHEFQLLDAVVHIDIPGRVFAGYHQIRPDAWWARAHIPGRPLFPGVLMVECAAQLCSFISHRYIDDLEFIGFAGIDNVKFRGAISPPACFVIVGRAIEVKRRRTICETQGFVDGVMVFEGTITGMPL